MIPRLFSFGSPQDPSPPKDDDLAVLRLIRSRRVGPATFYRLLKEHGSASAALAALPDIARAAGVRDYSPCPACQAEDELRAGRRHGSTLLRWDSAAYPAVLRQIRDAPPILWVAGDVAAMSRPSVAVIGARNASSLGLRMGHGMASGLAEAGLSVTAGLARGIDTAAHHAAIGHGTVAVLACGLDRVYPSENTDLARAIVDKGGTIATEYAFGTDPIARQFPARNRIVSGLCRATVVVEAAHRSGSLTTARLALDHGREVMAVPGHPMDARAAGCNALLRDGALLVRHSQDVIDALDSLPNEFDPRVNAANALAGHIQSQGGHAVALAQSKTPSAGADSLHISAPDTCGPYTCGPEAKHDPHRAILSRLSPTPVDENSLLRDLTLSPADAASILLELELDGRIIRSAGGQLALA